VIFIAERSRQLSMTIDTVTNVSPSRSLRRMALNAARPCSLRRAAAKGSLARTRNHTDPNQEYYAAGGPNNLYVFATKF
jgi:hypothetical protein